MRTHPFLSTAVALLCLWGGMTAAIAQQKTAKECEAEWRANKTQNQAQGISEKAYVVQCRAGTPPSAAAAAAPSPAPVVQQKTVKQCEAEWRANKAENQAKGISEKAYVTECRSASAAPGAPSPASAPSAPAGAAASSPPPASSAASTSPPPPAAAAPPTRVGTPAGANQFANMGQARARCPAGVVVWANLSSKIYHFSGSRDYGNTKRGAYMCEPDAQAEGFRAAKNEKHPM